MKTKIAGLASTALLLLAPISGAFSAVAESQVVQAENNWDYDTANPGLGEYDRLLQNAGPSDGQIDWYPAEHFASSKNIRPSLLVKQLIDLSIATNNANSNARKVLFNDTTGISQKSDYQDTYSKYKLAFGFIAQLLAFNNEKTGQGAYLKQGFDSIDGTTPATKFDEEEDKIAETQKTPDPEILKIPAIGEGVNISDVLGRAFFGNADDAYAQLYVNGYDNTVQNAPNIIRETTTSITIVAQSKLTGRKATAIFKLNNKTFNNLAPEVLLENNIDNSPSFGGGWGIDNIPSDEQQNYGDSTKGTFNQRGNLVTGLTDDQKRLLSNGGSSAWVDPKTGSGTIVVPRGTSAAEIAKKIKQLGYKSNYNISNVAPMKAIHGDYYTRNSSGTLARSDNSYNVDGLGDLSNYHQINSELNSKYKAVADPRKEVKPGQGHNGIDQNFSNSILTSPFNTNNDLQVAGHYNNTTASKIPNQGDTVSGNVDQPVGAGHDNTELIEAPRTTPWPAYTTDHGNGVGFSDKDNSIQNGLTGDGGLATYPFGGDSATTLGGAGGSDTINPEGANDSLGNVVHAFEPSSGVKDKNSPFKVREAWDDTHAIFGTAPFTGLTEEEVKNQIANNGSFNNTSGDQIKKSFTFNMPLNNMVMKSYRNPYSTVISTALPFSQDENTDFKMNTNYSSIPSSSIDMNGNDGTAFTGNYVAGTGLNEVPENPWYENSDGEPDSGPVDSTGHPIKLHGLGIRNSLHLNAGTWDTTNHYSETGNKDTGLHNVKSEAEMLDSSPVEKATEIEDWITNSAATSEALKPNVHANSASTNEVPRTPNPLADDPVQASTSDVNELLNSVGNGAMPGGQNKVIDAHNYENGNETEYRDLNNAGSLWIHRFNSAKDAWETAYADGALETTGPRGNFRTLNHTYTRPVKHLQLAKNVGYVLINRTNLSEKQAKALSQYQIPVKPIIADSDLDGIENADDFENDANRPTVKPVNDDPTYRGGLLGVQSIINKVSGSSSPVTQNLAGSIYNGNSLLDNNGKLVVPSTYPIGEVTIKNDDKVGSQPFSKGQFATDTDLHYGLAWNDSSDLPQVKIQRSLNVQYLVPVSIAREAETTYSENHKATVRKVTYRHTSGGFTYVHNEYHFASSQPLAYNRTVSTKYSKYKLFLGNVSLAGFDSNSMSGTDKVSTSSGEIIGYTHIDTGADSTSVYLNQYNFINTKDAIKNFRPVNNQIAYSRVDKSYPHYDSELFDHGSNTDDVTVTRDEPDRSYIGTSQEIETGTDRTKVDNVGSSDDYSIGIVKAPDELFNTNHGVPTGASLESKNLNGVDSTENRADGQQGINKFTDDPKNNNGMSIRDPKSYATLAQAYNVEINGNKAVGKADDNAKNKGDRVALVQQLLDNGGNAEAYYYIPSLPRLYEHWNEARINVVVYDKAAVPAPSKAETKPSFSTTDVSTGNDPFNVNLRPYTTVYDDGAVLKSSDVPQNFKNLLTRELVAGNPDLVTSDGKVATEKLQQILVGAFLNSWQQNDGSFNQTDTGVGVNSPLYLYGGFGISNSDSKNSYSQWPDGYTTPNLSSSKYHEAVTNYPGDFYRGGKDLKTTGATVIKGIPATALKADVSKVDLSKAGTYPVVYTYTNPSNDKDSASITVPVVVTDGAAPVFAFQGGSDLTIKVGESFDRSAFKVVGSWQIFNKYQGDYDKLVNYEGIAKNSKGEPDVTISGDVDTQTPGIYQLTYKATSIGGAVTTMKRNITVLPKETTGSDWKVSDFASVGYINYVPNYGINVWNAPAGTFTGQRLTHGTSWKIFQKAVNSQGKVYYQVGKNQWIDGAYVSFTPVSTMQPLNGIVTINYVRGYGVNLWKAPKTTGGYYEGRKLQDGTKWKVFGIQDGFYKVGGNQWIQAKYAKFQAR